MDLVDRGWPLGTVATPAPGMLGITFKLADAEVLLVHIGQEPAGCLAVEADCGDQHVLASDLAWPDRRVIFSPIVPTLHWRIVRQQSRRVAGWYEWWHTFSPSLHLAKLGTAYRT